MQSFSYGENEVTAQRFLLLAEVPHLTVFHPFFGELLTGIFEYIHILIPFSLWNVSMSHKRLQTDISLFKRNMNLFCV